MSFTKANPSKTLPLMDQLTKENTFCIEILFMQQNLKMCDICLRKHTVYDYFIVVNNCNICS